MIDKLKLRFDGAGKLTSQIVEAIKNQGFVGGSSSPRNTHYEKAAYFTHSYWPDRKLTLYHAPRLRLIAKFQIELNPSHFQSYEELIKLFEGIGPLECFTINRIDHAIDVNCSVREIHRTTSFPRKRPRVEYPNGRDLDGFKLGKGNDSITVYRKKGNEISRIERRQLHDRIKHKKLNEIPKYLEENIFHDMKVAVPKPLDFVPLEYQSRWYQWIDVTERYGLHNALKTFNQDYYRNIWRYFKPCLDLEHPVLSVINHSYHKELELFLDM